jgi:hypothetical protein
VMRKAYELFRDGGDTKEVISEVLRRILSMWKQDIRKLEILC